MHRAPIRLPLGRFALSLALCAALLPAAGASAQSDQQAPSESKEQREGEYRAAVAAASAALVKGPADIKLADKAVLHLPEGASWVPRAEADRFERAMGHRSNPELLGIVSGGGSAHGWLAIVTFTGGGFVKDDEAQKLDPDAILADLRSGQDRANEGRVARGFPALILDDWSQAPRYDGANKWLIWAVPVRTDAAGSRPTINYNTRALGREGYLSLNLLTDGAHFDADKGEAARLLKAVDYAPGHRYADFNPSTDRVAAYGLAALIGAVALKKLGLFAVATAFAVKFAKVGIIALIAAFAAVRRFLFRGRARDKGGSRG